MIHHRRKEGRPLTTRGAKSRLTTIRLPYALEAALKMEAEIQGKSWQTLLKAILADALGLSDMREDPTNTQTRPAADLHRAMRKLTTTK